MVMNWNICIQKVERHKFSCRPIHLCLLYSFWLYSLKIDSSHVLIYHWISNRNILTPIHCNYLNSHWDQSISWWPQYKCWEHSENGLVLLLDMYNLNLCEQSVEGQQLWCSHHCEAINSINKLKAWHGPRITIIKSEQ